jgi:hypothetical protein
VGEVGLQKGQGNDRGAATPRRRSLLITCASYRQVISSGQRKSGEEGARTSARIWPGVGEGLPVRPLVVICGVFRYHQEGHFGSATVQNSYAASRRQMQATDRGSEQ